MVHGVDVNASDVLCTVQDDGAVRVGLGYIKGVPQAQAQALVDERERGGRFASAGELAARAGVSRATLEQLAWSGACDSLLGSGGAEDRRSALWQMGVVTPAESLPGADGAVGTQLALPLGRLRAPRLRALGRWQRLIADYATTGVTVGEHALAILRPRLTVPRLATSAQLARLPTAYEVAVAGLVIARQKPGTAGGTMFLLFEDEFGTINLIVPKRVYERHRQLARAEPLLLARGRLERYAGASGADRLGRARGSARRRDARRRGARRCRRRRPRRGGDPPGDQRDRARAGFARDASSQTCRSRRRSRLARAPPAGCAAGAGCRRGRGRAGGRAGGDEVAASMRVAAPAVQSFATGRRR